MDIAQERDYCCHIATPATPVFTCLSLKAIRKIVGNELFSTLQTFFLETTYHVPHTDLMCSDQLHSSDLPRLTFTTLTRRAAYTTVNHPYSPRFPNLGIFFTKLLF